MGQRRQRGDHFRRRRGSFETLYIYSAGLKVIDAPQSQVGFLSNFNVTKRLQIGANYVYNWNLYARFQVDTDCTNPDRAGLQPVMLPAYGYLDLRGSYRFEAAGHELDGQLERAECIE